MPQESVNGTARVCSLSVASQNDGLLRVSIGKKMSTSMLSQMPPALTSGCQPRSA